MQTKKRSLLLGLFLLIGAVFASSAKAFCPICIVAVGAGLGLSRWLGVDDVISSLWIGALLVSSSWWTVIWLRKKNLAQLNAAKPQSRFARLFNWVKGFKNDGIVIPVLYYGLILAPLYYFDVIGHPLNRIFGIDKILFGTVFGSIIFLAAVGLHNFLKTKNGGKSFFPYQKVVIPVVILIIISIIIWRII